MTDREEMIQKAREWLRTSHVDGSLISHIGINELLADFALSLQPQWISVEERLPATGLHVLVYCAGRIHEDYVGRSDHEFTGTKSRATSRLVWTVQCVIADHPKSSITHWQPLPSPPVRVESSPEQKSSGEMK